MSLIFIHIAGNLGQDPETRFTPSGQKVTNMRVATTIKRGGKEKTVWWKVTMWGDRFDKKLAYLKKGSSVMVWGEMGIPDIYQDREGNPQTSFEIIAEHINFSPFGNKGGEKPMGSDEEAMQTTAAAYSVAGQTSGRYPLNAGGAVHPGEGSSGQFAEDDIPF